MASNATAIWNFLASKGLQPAQIAGIMGNLQVESGFNPGASNAGEGAIGIAQWEGGRRANLQEFARQHGGSETDLSTQLNYLWAELNGPYLHSLNSIRSMTDASQVASEFDAHFEVSSGAARQQRMANASNIFSTVKTSGAGGLSNLGPSSAGEVQLTGAAPGGVVDAKHTKADYTSALGDLAGLLTAVPELKGLLDTAIAKNQAPEDFANAIQSSKWYKQHNAATRSLVSMQYSDPAEYQAKLRTQRTMIEQQAAKLGVQVGPGRLEQLVHQSIVEGWDQQTLTNNLGQTLFNPKNPNQKLTGDIASAYQQMKQVYAAYGVAATDATLRNNALRIAEGMTTLDAYRTNVIQAAKSQYPGLSTQLDQGLTVADVAQPYQSSMAQLLEVDPATLGLNTPLIRQALQGKAGASADGKSTVPTSQPLWQFENQVRQDPRWAMTDNAHQQISTQLLQIGRDFGFAS